MQGWIRNCLLVLSFIGIIQFRKPNVIVIVLLEEKQLDGIKKSNLKRREYLVSVYNNEVT